MDSILRAKALYKFLRKNNLLYSYMDALVDKHSYGRGIKEFYNGGSFIDLLKTNRDIDHSFTWANTPQGHQYWEKLHHDEKKVRDRIDRDISIMKYPLSTFPF